MVKQIYDAHLQKKKQLFLLYVADSFWADLKHLFVKKYKADPADISLKEYLSMIPLCPLLVLVRHPLSAKFVVTNVVKKPHYRTIVAKNPPKVS